MKEDKYLVQYLRDTVTLLDNVHAEPDELFKVGAASSRIERLIEEIRNEGGKDGRINEAESQGQREADVERRMVLRCDGRNGQRRRIGFIAQRSDPEDDGCIRSREENAREIGGNWREKVRENGWPGSSNERVRRSRFSARGEVAPPLVKNLKEAAHGTENGNAESTGSDSIRSIGAEDRSRESEFSSPHADVRPGDRGV